MNTKEYSNVNYEEWITKQALLIAGEWEKAIEKYYPEHLETWSNPDKFLFALKNNWNTLDAIEYINWDKYLYKNNMKILDAGGGRMVISIFIKIR